ncbi:MAG: hypothetical protein A2664_02315 [Candidatus Taylorbacteria bacterium RIFCSPHIGHO2_01_FULL_46_22b]|uniref:GIY-YIG domain-containing protein n=1 Tax=Candidatus Taylorbacteria bacterium RIFCSPHIGHO2_01_FULL_46_22b TaxID=1802301 RepID=A0A1G2M3D4_9BACT|nr:MAG: hypothetical protein A2664_02315 [Candidatus Taylorbacteria bacterium RIFCSPHIGHO2_01_FULL_46_22b]
MYFVYIIRCSDDTLYTGITTDVERRFNEHKNGKGGHYTKSRKAVELLYTEKSPDRSSALKREAEIKSWSREEKLNLINKEEASKSVSEIGQDNQS